MNLKPQNYLICWIQLNEEQIFLKKMNILKNIKVFTK